MNKYSTFENNCFPVKKQTLKIVFLLIFAAFITGCVGFPDTPIPAEYVGRWEGNGKLIVIDADGVSGKTWGTRVGINEAEKTLTIGFLGFGSTHHIDQPPIVSNYRYKMVLDGVTYTSNQYVK